MIHSRCMRWAPVWCATVLIGALVLLVAADPAWANGAEVPEPLAEVVDEALGAWAALAERGDVEILDGTFAVGSPQRRQLKEEAMEGVSPSAPTSFVARELRLRSMASETATVWVRVEASRPGFATQVLDWDFDLVRRGGRWLVWSVVEAAPPTHAAISEGPVPPVRVTTTTSPASPTSVVDAPAAANKPAALTGAGVKLPVLSAWIVVITFVGVVAAGYLAPRLERRERS